MNLNFFRIIQDLMKNVCYWTFLLLGVNLIFIHFLLKKTHVKLHSHVRIFLSKSVRKGECKFILLRYVKV